MLSRIALTIGFVLGLLALGAAAQPVGEPGPSGIEWTMPVAQVSGKPLLQTKFSGPRSELSLEVEALQKVLAPADGMLIHSGALSSKLTGFVILHRDGWVSLIKSPLSWEQTSDLRSGSSIEKGQVLAVVRGGRTQIMRQLGWSLHRTGGTDLAGELRAWAGRVDSAEGRPPWVERLQQSPEVNLKGLLGYGTLQLNLQAGSNPDDCSVRIAGWQTACQLAEQQDLLLPIGYYKLEVQSGKFFKSTATATSFVSSMDTIVQRIEKDDKGNYLASGYVVEQREARKAALASAPESATAVPSVDAAAAAQREQAEAAERERQLALVEEARQKQEAEARREQDRLAREAVLQAQQTRARLQALADEEARQKREAEAREQARLQMEAEAREQARLANEARLLAQQREAARKEQQEKAEQAERVRLLALAQEQARAQREADALKERERAASELLLQAQQRDAARREQAERERQLALAQEQTRAKAEAEAQERAAALARQRETQELARVNAELNQLKAQMAKNQASSETVVAGVPPAMPAGSGKRRALVMGNDAYKDVPVLQNARSDARAMAAMLGRLGFEVATHTDLDERGMKQAIRNFKSRVRGGDEVVVFFAGHGVQLGATNYLLPVDIHGQSEDQVRDEAIPLQRLLDDIQDTKAGFALAIIDACRDNPFKTATRAIGGRGLAATSAATGQMVMFSAGTGQQALDRLGPNDKEPNGLFTRVLLKEMDKPGVSIERLVRNVRNEVARLSKTVGHDQVPAVYDQTLGDFFFKP